MNLFEKIWIYCGLSLIVGATFLMLSYIINPANIIIPKLANRLPLVASLFTFFFYLDLIYSLVKYLEKIDKKQKLKKEKKKQ